MNQAATVSPAEIASVVERYSRFAISVGAKAAGLDADEAKSVFALAAVEAAEKFEPEKGAKLETYAVAWYRTTLKQINSQRRYGLDLDDDEAPAAAQLYTIDQHDQDGDEQEQAEPWRTASDEEIQRRISVLPADLRDFAMRILDGNSIAEASAGRMTSRNGRYVLAKITEIMRKVPASGRVF